MKNTSFTVTYSELFYLKIANVNMLEACELAASLIAEKKSKAIFTPNASLVNKAMAEPAFLKILQSADLLIPDGMSLVLASRVLKRSLKEKVSGSSYFLESCLFLGNIGFKIFIMGAADGVADLAKNRIQKKNPKINIIGTYSPKYGFEKDEEERRRMIELINVNKPDVIYFALPDGKGERWIIENMNYYHPCINIQIGAAVDFVAGLKTMPPNIFKKLGMAWFWRLMAEPFPRKKRIMQDNFMILKHFIKYYKNEKSINNRN